MDGRDDPHPPGHKPRLINDLRQHFSLRAGPDLGIPMIHSWITHGNVRVSLTSSQPIFFLNVIEIGVARGWLYVPIGAVAIAGGGGIPALVDLALEGPAALAG